MKLGCSTWSFHHAFEGGGVDISCITVRNNSGCGGFLSLEYDWEEEFDGMTDTVSLIKKKLRV